MRRRQAISRVRAVRPCLGLLVVLALVSPIGRQASLSAADVRDRNDQPIAGAVVKFAIQGGRATFSGAKTLTVTTNVAGRAAVSSLTPTASGSGDGGQGTSYTGPFSGPLIWNFLGPPVCTRTHMMSGTLKMVIEVAADGIVSGTAQLTGTSLVIALPAGCGGPQVGTTDQLAAGPTPVSGNTANLLFNWQASDRVSPSPTDPKGGVHTVAFTFAGASTGNEITGTLTHTETATALVPTPGTGGTGTATYAVTLR